MDKDHAKHSPLREIETKHVQKLMKQFKLFKWQWKWNKAEKGYYSSLLPSFCAILLSGASFDDFFALSPPFNEKVIAYYRS